MSTFSKFKLVSTKRQKVSNPVTYRRHKLALRISEQIELLLANREGRVYAPTRLKSVVDASTGLRRVVETPKRVKEWFWPSPDGKILLEIRYGSKILPLNNKGATAIEVGDALELVSTLELVRQATVDGELDFQIDMASKALRDGFDRNK